LPPGPAAGNTAASDAASSGYYFTSEGADLFIELVSAPGLVFTTTTSTN
jgi:hypothetical protein